ncbi:phosphoribosylanthranilate isomerase [Glycomyces xiaoerkulensis]|uniref:phosphoribosylanthranilate isomerase n=1 Tax=Glycomyces xiaoerkulensis TaxID=2038139 RepID=UPI000C2576B8|nr:phosphoribosylanthranilate isomerase [Glycomyces xiaoerkulensis]
MFVKICGLTESEHVAAAAESGADAVGFLLSPSPRRVTPERARELASAVPPGVLTVGVFAGVPVETIRRDAADAGVGAVQLHGDYRREDFEALADFPAERIRAVPAALLGEVAFGAFGEDYLIVDSPRPGSGETWDWNGLQPRPDGRWMLAGGLDPDLVAAAIEQARPWGVDVSSGVEARRGVKDPGLIARFVANAKGTGS